MLTRFSSRRSLIGSLLLVAIIAAACQGAATPSGGSGGGDVPAAGATLKVGSTMDLAPLDMVDDQGNPTGYELDVVKAVADKLGYKLEFVKTPFEQAFTGLLANKYDFNASAIYTRCQRVKDKAQYGQFTVPVGWAGQALTATADTAANYTSFNDLKGKTIGVESAGSTADGVADANASAGFKKEIFPDNNALFLALEQGRIDAALQSEDVSRYTIKDKPGLQVAFIVPDSRLTYGWIFRAGDPLRDKFNETINTLKTDGTIPGIYKEWFGTDPAADDPAKAILPEITEATCKG
jgi:ABC-type amino acid transport substrate-binding protein